MADNGVNLEVQRSLGLIEGTQQQILDELKQLRADFNGHVQADDRRFAHIEADRNKAKGAGWVILTMLTGLASIVGGAVLAVLEGWLKFH